MNIAPNQVLLATMIFLSCMNSGMVNAADERDHAASAKDTVSVAQGYEDPRLRVLARQLVNYSLDLKKGEKILVSVKNDVSVPLAKVIIEEAYRIGAIPFVDIMDEQLNRALCFGATAERYQLMFSWDSLMYSQIDALIVLDGSDNWSEMSDIPAEKSNLESQYWKGPLKKMRPKWCGLHVPSSGLAQLAGMSTEAFTDFYFSACTMNYDKLSQAMEPLVKLMEATDKVRIVGFGTDLTFSIKGIPAVKCIGWGNIPDGELFTAPVKNSVNGILTVNQPSKWLGVTYQNIQLEFVDGRIIRASANGHSEKLNQLLDIDEGARYLGEFAFGLNPYIERPIGLSLFDEKISMSFHLAIGNSYSSASNGNVSSMHWDLVSIQTLEFGGGEIWFDGKLIRKDGLFVPPELQVVNPENLK
jgi:aminopeptidase